MNGLVAAPGLVSGTVANDPNIVRPPYNNYRYNKPEGKKAKSFTRHVTEWDDILMPRPQWLSGGLETLVWSLINYFLLFICHLILLTQRPQNDNIVRKNQNSRLMEISIFCHCLSICTCFINHESLTFRLHQPCLVIQLVNQSNASTVVLGQFLSFSRRTQIRAGNKGVNRELL